MRTWRTYFVIAAQTAFWVLHGFRGYGFLLPIFWHILMSLILGILMGLIINQWESYHQDWLDREFAADEEEEESNADTRN